MSAINDHQRPPIELIPMIKHRIAQRTGRGIRGLAVGVTDGRGIIRGGTSRYHLEQLAREAAHGLVGLAGVAEIACAIDVAPVPADPIERRE